MEIVLAILFGVTVGFLAGGVDVVGQRRHSGRGVRLPEPPPKPAMPDNEVVSEHAVSPRASIATSVNPRAKITTGGGQPVDMPASTWIPSEQQLRQLEGALDELNVLFSRVRLARIHVAIKAILDTQFPGDATATELHWLVVEHYRQKLRQEPTQIDINQWKTLLS